MNVLEVVVTIAGVTIGGLAFLTIIALASSRDLT